MRKAVYEDETVTYKCPGCGLTHIINTDRTLKSPCWDFNGDEQNPTLHPSVNAWQEGPNGKVRLRCHHFVKQGKIQFLNDCTHALKGQTVELPDVIG